MLRQPNRAGLSSRQNAAQLRFNWSRALYTRLPEGLVTGFMGGTVGSLLTAILISKGHPEPLTVAAIAVGGMTGGSILGILGGLLYAAVESVFRTVESSVEEEIRFTQNRN